VPYVTASRHYAPRYLLLAATAGQIVEPPPRPADPPYRILPWPGLPPCLRGLRIRPGRYASAVSARSILLIVSPAATTA
jgi:hypothetical protein